MEITIEKRNDSRFKRMKRKRTFARGIPLFVLGLVVVAGVFSLQRGMLSQSSSAASANRDQAPAGDDENSAFFENGGGGNGGVLTGTKTDRPRRRLSEIELERAQKEFWEVQKRYMSAHPEYLRGEERVQELQAMVHSATE